LQFLSDAGLTHMQLVAAAITPAAEHTARRPVGAADAAAADANVRKIIGRERWLWDREVVCGAPIVS
jgi:hypothetical protein